MTAEAMLAENRARLGAMFPRFNPVTGEGAPLERVELRLPDHELPVQWIPRAMADTQLVRGLMEAGSLEGFVRGALDPGGPEEARALTAAVVDQLERLRLRHDFAYWAGAYAYIHNKDGGRDVTLRLNSPQRRLVAEFERQRLAGLPIRDIILKARQWGGSTCTQMYMAWLQLAVETGLNSLIVAQVSDIAAGIKDMFRRMLARYPVRLLHPMGGRHRPGEKTFETVQGTRTTHSVPQRGCKIKIASAERPDSCRGENYSLVHCSEVGVWKATDGRTPEEIVKAATSGVLLRPMTMIVYESTAKGVGNFFHDEWTDAKAGGSQFTPFFVAWHEIEQYRLPLGPSAASFAEGLYRNRLQEDAPSDREESGAYLWSLWRRGATLEGVNWYIGERRKYRDRAGMASEYPTDDDEAFTHSGRQVFSAAAVERLAPTCRPPREVGELYGRTRDGDGCLRAISFRKDATGRLLVWERPEPDEEGETVADRYLCVADVGRGLGDKADFSVVVVLDRMMMADGEGRPQVVAQWRGHIDMDLLAWKAAQLAAWYNNALLVIESNTLESAGGISPQIRDTTPFVLQMIGEAYPNLYMREQSAEDIRRNAPRKYGFHTNAKTKGEVVDFLIRAVREGMYIERDRRVLDELMAYETTPRGGYAAPPGKHDDMLMTRAIGLYVCFNHMDTPRAVSRADYARLVRRSVGEADI
ncbi:MAG: terminase [Prevotellaceae bacterium]|nr:terminase [Prevotellaceae bacterium]